MVRMISQVALVAWCFAEAALLILSRKRMTEVVGVWWALIGLACFAGWMALSSITIRDTALVPRGSVVWVFALLELGATIAAWANWIANVRRSFHFHFRITELLSYLPFL